MVFLRGYAKKLMKDALKTETLRQVVQNISKHAKKENQGPVKAAMRLTLFFAASQMCLAEMLQQTRCKDLPRSQVPPEYVIPYWSRALLG
jgi:hypothetical protein